MTAFKKFRIQNSEFRIGEQIGFSLIEVLIAIGIIALIGAVAVPNLNNFSKNQELSATAGQVVNVLKTAQSSAQSRIQCPRGEPSEAWYVKLSANSYSYYAECQTTGEDEFIYSKPYSPGSSSGTKYEATLNVCNGDTVDIIFSKNQILYRCFSDPSTTFTVTTPVELTLKDPSNSANQIKVKIEAGGIIKVE